MAETERFNQAQIPFFNINQDPAPSLKTDAFSTHVGIETYGEYLGAIVGENLCAETVQNDAWCYLAAAVPDKALLLVEKVPIEARIGAI